ncbi:MAG: isopentenyl-diphosphate Delta-isomerase [bacterium]|nr:isopentenyl-diphosphate Delta-isomerase [bacterium]
MPNKEEVILVDSNDSPIGTCEKMQAHIEGKLHRAFSIFIFNSKNEMLIQKRALSKYHCAGLWSNSCCSHPMPGESTEDAVHRRLREELGFDCELEEVFSFVYKIKFEDNGLIEHELDHVFIGTDDPEPVRDPDEIEEFKWIEKETLLREISENPENFTFWFKESVNKVLSSRD